MAGTPDDGLRLLDDPALTTAIEPYHHFHLTRADLLPRAGRANEATEAYEEARRRSHNKAEHDFVDRRLDELV